VCILVEHRIWSYSPGNFGLGLGNGYHAPCTVHGVQWHHEVNTRLGNNWQTSCKIWLNKQGIIKQISWILCPTLYRCRSGLCGNRLPCRLFQRLVKQTTKNGLSHVTTRIRKIAKSDYQLRPVCLSVRIELGSQRTDFHEILYQYFSKIRRQKSDRNNGYFTRRSVHIFDISLLFFDWEMFLTRVVPKIKTSILCAIISFSENRTVYEIIWKNSAKLERPHDNIIQHMRFA
jgi:hypothetical protein